MIQFKFDSNQPYQLDAIQAITDLFTGQPLIQADLSFISGQSFFAAVSNRLDLSQADLLVNLHTVQEHNGITLDSDLYTIQAEIITAEGPRLAHFYNFTVEMETGTGKTYVYLRTAFELYRRYGLRKYIVVVPSVAVREGVLKTLQVTESHFRGLYDNAPCHYYAYDSANLSQIRQFALSDSIEIMIMTLAAFNKASNIIRQTTDRLQGETPIHLVQTTHPILILDEPQNMESEKSIAALALLDPLLALRYSATHRNPYNVVYRLTPYEAYRQKLVKKIQVASVIREGETAQPYICLHSVKSQGRVLTACMGLHVLMKDGTIKEKTLTIRPGDSLQEKTGRAEYNGYEVEEINTTWQSVRFVNNQEVRVGQEIGADKDAIFAAQIRYTIEEHMRKQAHFRAQGIKVLSLFFIDRVDNYAPADGLIRQLFGRAFDELKPRYPDWNSYTADQVQAAYFAQHCTRTGDIILEDSSSGEADKDRAAYELIMQAKERLLSFEEPVAFIFSHSALREGWDNPNIFQICTLNQTASEVKKRQEVGRGVRLAVNQSGERVLDESVNILTVVANQSYEHFVAQLQDEIAFEYREEIEARYGKPIRDLSDAERRQIEQEYGQGILPPLPLDAHRQRGVARLRKEYTLRPEFQELWEKIKHKTRYHVKIDHNRLIRNTLAELASIEIKPPRVTITKVELEAKESLFQAIQMTGVRTAPNLSGRFPLPNLLDIMANLMEHTAPPMRLPRRTLLEIVQLAPATIQQAAISNPNEFAAEAVRVLKTKMADELVAGIEYEKINDWYEMTQLEDIPAWDEYLVPAERSVYDHVICDSDIERDFVTEIEENRRDVRMYIKLPRWFTVPTPVGEYNPDWAIVMEQRDEHGDITAGQPLLYLVRETKSTHNRNEWRPEERRKVACGERHFIDALGTNYKVVVDATELP